MSGARIKSIIIAALLLINILFLTVIIIDAVDDARSERETIENISAILRGGGITINPDNITTAGPIRTMRTSRVPEVEENIARVFLGEAVMTDQGIIYLYENAHGMAEFGSTGYFVIRMNPDVITSSGDAIRTVQTLLRDMQIETNGVTELSDQDDGTETLVAVGAYRGARIFNCTVEFIFIGNSLNTVQGRYVAGIESHEDGVEISQVGTALLGFLSAVRDELREDVDCTEIFGVESGFRHRVVGNFGEGVIEPAWLISTDNGQFLIDDTTGEIWPWF